MTRRRWAYTLGGQPLKEPVEVSDDYRGGDGRSAIVSDAFMDGTRSPIDGSDIGSRTKRREHMRLHGLADADDYRGTWARAAKRRDDIRTGVADRNERRAAVARALEKMR